MQPVSYTRCPLGQHCNPCSVSRCLFLWSSSIGLVLTRLLEGIGHNLFPSPRLLRFLVSFEITSCTSGTESTTFLSTLSLSLSLSHSLSRAHVSRNAVFQRQRARYRNRSLRLAARPKGKSTFKRRRLSCNCGGEKALSLSEEEKKQGGQEVTRLREEDGDEGREPTPFNLQLIAGN